MKTNIVILIIVSFLILAPHGGLADHKHNERYYQNIWCAKNNGHAEIKLSDGTRCDCQTATHSIEVDFAPKWAEAIGQSLHYARITNHRAGIVIIMKESNFKYLKRLKNNIEYYKLPIDVWIIKE